MSHWSRYNSSWLFWGSFAALGRPGIALAPCYAFGIGALCYGALTATSWKQTALRCLGFGVGLAPVVAIGGISWGLPVPAGIFLTILLVTVLPIGLAARLCDERCAPRYRLALMCLLTATWLNGCTALGIPAFTMATSLVGALPVLLGGARIVGMPLIEGVLVATIYAGAISWRDQRASAWRERSKRALLSVGKGALLLGALSTFAHATAPRARDTARVGIPQINADASYYSGRLSSPAIQRAFDDRLAKLTKQLSDVELVAFPETFDGRYGLLLRELLEGWRRHARRFEQALVLTSYLPERDGRKSNAAAVIGASGTLMGVHRKVILAPYGERDLRPGSKHESIEFGHERRLGILICQESMSHAAAKQLTREGAQLIIATTSDISFGSSVLAFEHLAATRLVAIEVGRAIVWASNGGPSGVIDRWGADAGLAPFRAPVALKAGATLYEGLTPITRFSLAWELIELAGLVMVAWAGRGRQASVNQGPSVRPPAPSALLAAGAALLTAAALCVASPALVEIRQASSARALLAIQDLFLEKPSVEPGGLDRLATDSAHTAHGAAACLLTYYGVSKSPDEIAFDDTRPTLDTIARTLEREHGLRTQRIQLEKALPHVPVIVEVTPGVFGVLAEPEADKGWLFVSSAGGLAGSPLQKLAGRPALLPQY